MKIGTIVLAGAAGLALAGAAQADRFVSSSPTVSVNGMGGLDAERTWTATPQSNPASNAREISSHRRLQAALSEISHALNAGVEIDKSRLLLIDVPGLELGHDSNVDKPFNSGSRSATTRTDIFDGGKYDFFDGFQTYNLGNLAGQSINSPMGGNVGGTNAAQQVVDATTQTSHSVNDPTSANLRDPRNPYGVGNYPEGTNAAEHILFDNRTSALEVPVAQRVWTLFHDDLFVPTTENTLLVALDAYYHNYELLSSIAPVSFTEQFILTRILDAGRWETTALTSSTGGVLDRPAVLGNLPDVFGFGQFFAPPIQPLDSSGNPVGLSRFQTQTGEWFTYVTVMTTSGLTVWVRNSITDGSNGILIEDPAPPVSLLASGWYRAYPGRPANNVGAGVWTGYGQGVNEFGQQADVNPSPGAAVSFDGFICEWFTIGVPDDTGGWNPRGKYYNNLAVIGETLPTPPVPKRRLPYKDDIELYFAGMPVSLIPGWVDNLSSRAVVAFGSFNGSSVNASPSPGSHGGTSNQSIAQRNVVGDNNMRSEFNTATPSVAQQPIAAPGVPVTASANIRLTSVQTIRGMQVNDTILEGVAEFLMMSSVNQMDNIVPRFMIRRQNPFFDETEPTAATARTFEYPVVANNTFNLNFPTNTFVNPFTDAGGGGGSFFNAQITLNGDGTAFWSINGTRLTFLLDTNVFDPSQIAQLEMEFQEAQMIAGEPVGAPYSLFLTDMYTLNNVAFWSGNQALGFNDRIFADDICIEGFLAERSPGPDFELPFCEDFANHFVGRVISGNGFTTFAAIGNPDGAGVDFQQRTILATEDDALGDATTQWCSYTIAEVFDGDAAWGVSVGDVLYVREPAIAGFDCPERDNIPEVANLTLIDSDEEGLSPFPVRVGSPTSVMGNGSAADIRSTFTRYDSEAVFCRYEIISIEAEDDPGSGGTPFPIPSELAMGNVLAVTNPFTGGCVTSLNAMGASQPFNANFALFEDDMCIFATAQLLLLNPPGMLRTGTPAPTLPPVAALDSDIRGYGINTTPVNLWGGFVSPLLGGVVRVAQDEIDEVLSVSIDPSGARGNVLAYFNSGATATTGTTGGVGTALSSQNTIGFPTVVAAEATSELTEITAKVCWDYYIQDNNTRVIAQVNGPRFDEKEAPEASAPVTRIRFGGPPADPPTMADPIGNDTEIAVQVIIPPMGFDPAITAWDGTGVHRPTGQWFTSCVEVDANGNWTLAVDDTQIAAGASITQPSMGISVPMGIANLQFRSGFDSDGTDAPEVTPFVARSLGASAPRPAGTTANTFCFYEIQSIVNTMNPATATFHPVDPVSGAAILVGGMPENRVINAPDDVIVAVRFFDSGGLINGFSDCPTIAPFQLVDGSNNIIGEGTWFLTGRPDIDFPAFPPAGGIVNAGGPAGNNFAYNRQGMFDDNAPYRNILLAEAAELPVFGAPGIPSRWWVDMIKQEQLGGEPTAPPCPWDLTGSGSVGSGDLGFLLGCWGPAPIPACQPADFTGSGSIGSGDLAELLGSWGPCPTE